MVVDLRAFRVFSRIHLGISRLSLLNRRSQIAAPFARMENKVVGMRGANFHAAKPKVNIGLSVYIPMRTSRCRTILQFSHCAFL